PALRRGATWWAGARMDRGEREATGDRRGDEPLGSRTVAQLAVSIVSPAVRRAGRCHAAGFKGTTGAQRGEREAPRDRCGDQPLGSRTVAQLAVAVVAPAVRHARRPQGARMIVTRVQCSDVADARRAHGEGEPRRAVPGAARAG